ncbi:MAG: tyrosine--tRNA ligase [Alphaproteobacteria bacterium]|nr:tyrosine--tRNA ligase [Alphaproteobacteria bacterium]
MADYRSEFLRVLQARGFIHQISDPEGLEARLNAGPVTAYIGFDCTANSFHVGNLVQIMALYWLQQTGNRPVFLMGSGTTRIGDPSGKSQLRQMLSPQQIEANKISILSGVQRLLRFGDGPTDAIMADNADWLLDLNYVNFLRDYGRHFSVNQMIARDSIRTRLEREQHLSLLEFNYMVLQAYDFVELYRRTGCILQMGGSDQWGNILSGVDLGRRTDEASLFALTTPLITTASGAKMGKTADGAVWLNEAQRSPYEYWQFWRNAEDADVGRFLRLFTTLDLGEITRLEALEGAELNEAKQVLATAATALLHGDEAAKNARNTAIHTFETGTLDLSLPTIKFDRSRLYEAFTIGPSSGQTVEGETGTQVGIPLAMFLVEAKLATSNGMAIRLIQQGAVRINDKKQSDRQYHVSEADLVEGVIKLSVGKKRHLLMRPE